MHIILMLALGSLPAAGGDFYAVQADLQGIYDEISQATLQFVHEAEVDQFHDVFYTPDWVLVDAAGQRHPWAEVRARDIQALSAPRPASILQSIKKLSLTPDNATALVTVTIARSVVDDEGRYGPKGASHTLKEMTVYRDTWVPMADKWKFKSREQIGQPRLLVDKPRRRLLTPAAAAPPGE